MLPIQHKTEKHIVNRLLVAGARTESFGCVHHRGPSLPWDVRTTCYININASYLKRPGLRPIDALILTQNKTTLPQCTLYGASAVTLSVLRHIIQIVLL